MYHVFFENIYLSNSFDQIKTTLNDFKSDFENSELIDNSRFLSLSESFESQKKLLTVFINRKQILQISDNIDLLSETYKYDKTEFLVNIQTIILQLEEIEEYEKFNFYGIL